MKKVFFSFAIATMMAGLVACNGTSNQNNEGQDSTAVEAGAEAEAEAVPEVKVLTEIHDIFQFEVPTGWEGQSESYGCSLRLPKDDKGHNIVHMEINATEAAFDETKNLVYGLTADDKVAEEQVGEYTWTVYAKPNDKGEGYSYLAVAPRPGREGYVYGRGYSENGYDDDVKLALKGIKLLK